MYEATGSVPTTIGGGRNAVTVGVKELGCTLFSKLFHFLIYKMGTTGLGDIGVTIVCDRLVLQTRF